MRIPRHKRKGGMFAKPGANDQLRTEWDHLYTGYISEHPSETVDRLKREARARRLRSMSLEEHLDEIVSKIESETRD